MPNEIKIKETKPLKSKMDFSTKACIYDAMCHLMYFCVLIITIGDIKMEITRKTER